MKEELEELEEKQIEPKIKTLKIKPLRDHVIKHNEFFYDLKKGEEIEVDIRFKQTLKTEKVMR